MGDCVRLFKLLKKVNINNCYKKDIKINAVVCDSRKVVINDIFVCIKGQNHDGHDYVNEAIDKGASVIIYQNDIIKNNPNIYYFRVENSKKIYSQLLEVIYERLQKKVNIIGVTGTNGKTSITTLIHNFFSYKSIPSMLIGTNGIYYGDKLNNSINTTPDIDVIYNCIEKCIKEKIKYLIMEVSSIAIEELRVYGIKFNQLIMTNLTVDHLDYHKDISSYLYTKGIIFSKIKNDNKNFVILNKDDKSFDLFNRISECKVISYGLDRAKITAENISYKIDKMSFSIRIGNSYYEASTNLVGKFNVYNILAFVALVYNLGYEINDILYYLTIFRKIPGRMEVFRSENKTLIVDYAHTPDGVKQVLDSIKNMGFKNTWVVMGCGGNRDSSKRSMIGSILDECADNIVLTNDNPRFEDEQKIINDIEEGIKKEHYVCLDRYKAIKLAYDKSSSNDVILILGKGVEKVQIKENEVIKYSDIEAVKDIIGG